MEKHHRESIEKFIDRYKNDEKILALLLAGSIAHGFAAPESDIDVMIMVEEEAYQQRKRENKLAFSVWDICTYPGGYVDCKVVSLSFLTLIADQGSDPARFAFQDSRILFSRISGLEAVLNRVVRFNREEKDERRRRFLAQLLAWKWYYSEAVKKHNPYLLHLAIQKLILFACRIVLNENNRLYPYHKWLLAVTQSADHKPQGFDTFIETIGQRPTLADVNSFIATILDFTHTDEKQLDWPNQFLIDSEFNWINQRPPVDDV